MKKSLLLVALFTIVVAMAWAKPQAGQQPAAALSQTPKIDKILSQNVVRGAVRCSDQVFTLDQRTASFEKTFSSALFCARIEVIKAQSARLSDPQSSNELVTLQDKIVLAVRDYLRDPAKLHSWYQKLAPSALEIVLASGRARAIKEYLQVKIIPCFLDVPPVVSQIAKRRLEAYDKLSSSQLAEDEAGCHPNKPGEILTTTPCVYLAGQSSLAWDLFRTYTDHFERVVDIWGNTLDLDLDYDAVAFRFRREREGGPALVKAWSKILIDFADRLD